MGSYLVEHYTADYFVHATEDVITRERYGLSLKAIIRGLSTGPPNRSSAMNRLPRRSSRPGRRLRWYSSR
jgi:hypothetical protein